MKKSNLLAGIILGAIAGLAAGVLLAPASGEETRKNLKRKAEELKNEAESFATHFEENAKRTAEELKEKFQDYLNIKKQEEEEELI